MIPFPYRFIQKFTVMIKFYHALPGVLAVFSPYLPVHSTGIAKSLRNRDFFKLLCLKSLYYFIRNSIIAARLHSYWSRVL